MQFGQIPENTTGVHSWQRVPNPSILWKPYISYSPPPSFAIFFPKPPPPAPLLWLNVWSCQMEFVVLLNNIMDRKLPRLGNLVPAAPYCVSHITRHPIYWRFDTVWQFAKTLIWYHTHTGHTGTKRMTNTYKYVLTPPITYSQQLTVLHLKISLLI